MQGVEQNEGEQQVRNQMMQPRPADVEIPAREWTSFLESFSLQHEGWLATISVVFGNKTSIKVRYARLECITTSELDDDLHVRITMLVEDDEPLVYEVPNPVGVTFKQNLSGAHEGLDITSGDRSVTSLRFRVAANPETLDDVLPDLHSTKTMQRAHKASRL